MFGDNAQIAITSVLVPLIVVLWISCLAICLYKHISSRLEARQTTSVTVVVGTPSRQLPTPLFTPSNRTITTQHITRIDPTYAPVTSHIASSMTMADFLKGKGDIGLNDSLGPKYYPKDPISTITDPLETTPANQMFPSPMAPLQPPWPHLPPIDTVKANDKAKTISLSSSGASRSFNNRVNFLSSQILNLQNQQPTAENGRGTRGPGSDTSTAGRTRSERRQARIRF